MKWSPAYWGPQTLVLRQDMKNSSNYISAQKLKTENNYKYLPLALCCEGPPSLHVAYDKCNIKRGVKMSWNEKPFAFTPHEKEPSGLKWLLIKYGSFWFRTTGTQQAIWTSCCQLLKAIVADCGIYWVLRSSVQLPDLKRLQLHFFNVCFQCYHSNQYCPRYCWQSAS